MATSSSSWGAIDTLNQPQISAPWPKIDNLQAQTTPVICCRQEGIVSRRLDMLAEKIDTLETKFDLILSRLDNIESIFGDEEVIELRDIPKEQAKEDVRQYFKDHHGENLDASDIGEALNLDIFLVDDLMHELATEGKIKEV